MSCAHQQQLNFDVLPELAKVSSLATSGLLWERSAGKQHWKYVNIEFSEGIMLLCDAACSSECFNVAYTICFLFHPVTCGLTGVYPRIQTKDIIQVHLISFFWRIFNM